MEILSDLAINAIYDLVKSGFSKAYNNVKLVFRNKNIDDDIIKLVHEAIKDKSKDEFANVEELKEYLNKIFTSKKINTIQNSPNSIIVTESQNTNITIQNINKISKPKKEKFIFSGTIGTSHAQKVYIKYLIDRYNEFKESHEKGKMNYSIIYSNIKQKFKMKWDDIPVERFEELVDFLKAKINKTIIGKNNISQKHINYESFEEFKEKYL